MRLVTDMIEWCSGHMPRWHPISISGYHIREAGSTAGQELAFTLKDGLTYVEQAIARGLNVDDFAPRWSCFFNAHIDFFEEIAKYLAKIDELGGMVTAIKTGFPQREIADAAFRYQQEVESGARRLVGVNAYTEGDDHETPILRIDPQSEREQIQRVQAVRERRDAPRADDALERLERAAREPDVNLMPYLIEAA